MIIPERSPKAILSGIQIAPHDPFAGFERL
jgi:hypothetical protein